MSPNTSLANYGSYISSTFRVGNVLFIAASIALSRATNWSQANLRVFTLAENGRPAQERTAAFCALLQTSGGGFYPRNVTVGTDGQVVLPTTDVDGVTAVRLIGAPVRLD